MLWAAENFVLQLKLYVQRNLPRFLMFFYAVICITYADFGRFLPPTSYEKAQKFRLNTNPYVLGPGLIV